jgi:hypothetical protein
MAAYNINPTPQQGQGAFGSVPGVLGMPNPAADLGSQLPGLTGLNTTASGDIMAQLQGQLSPGTLNALKSASAVYGQNWGMPGSGFETNALMGNIAGFSEGQVNKGIANYNSLIPTVSSTQTVSPALQTEISTQNALNAAAPNPGQAASYAQSLFDKYLKQLRGPGGGTVSYGGGGGGTTQTITSAPPNYSNGPWLGTVPNMVGSENTFGGSWMAPEDVGWTAYGASGNELNPTTQASDPVGDYLFGDW